jgi:hypothetical protein
MAAIQPVATTENPVGVSMDGRSEWTEGLRLAARSTLAAGAATKGGDPIR